MAQRELLSADSGIEKPQKHLWVPHFERFTSFHSPKKFFADDNIRADSILVPLVSDDPEKGRDIYELTTNKDSLWVLKFYPQLDHPPAPTPPTEEYEQLIQRLSELQHRPKWAVQRTRPGLEEQMHDGVEKFISVNWDGISRMLTQDDRGIKPTAFREVKFMRHDVGKMSQVAVKPDIVAIAPSGEVFIFELGISVSRYREVLVEDENGPRIKLKRYVRRSEKNAQARDAGEVFSEELGSQFPVRTFSVLYKTGRNGAVELSFKETSGITHENGEEHAESA